MTILAPLLALGWFFWIAAFIFIVAVASANNHFKAPVSALSLVLVGAGVALLYIAGYGISDAWTYLTTNTREVATWVLLYIGIGIVYAAVRWYFRLRYIRNEFVEYRNVYDEYRGNSTPMSAERRKTFSQNISQEFGIYDMSIPPRISEHHNDAMRWMILWVFCWINLQPLTALYNAVYQSIAGAFQSMSDRMFKDMN